MAWTEADRVQIRGYLGYSSQFLQADPRLENAMTNAQAIADGGTRPNPSPSAAETQVRLIIANLQSIDTFMLNLGQFAGATKVDGGEAMIDAAREDLDSVRSAACTCTGWPACSTRCPFRTSSLPRRMATSGAAARLTARSRSVGVSATNGIPRRDTFPARPRARHRRSLGSARLHGQDPNAHLERLSPGPRNQHRRRHSRTQRQACRIRRRHHDR